MLCVAPRRPMGVAQLRADQPGAQTTTHPLRRLHVRWRAPAAGPALDLQLKQNPLVATPGLVAQPVDLTEVKGAVEAPLAGALRARSPLANGVREIAPDLCNGGKPPRSIGAETHAVCR